MTIRCNRHDADDYESYDCQDYFIHIILQFLYLMILYESRKKRQAFLKTPFFYVVLRCGVLKNTESLTGYVLSHEVKGFLPQGHSLKGVLWAIMKGFPDG